MHKRDGLTMQNDSSDNRENEQCIINEVSDDDSIFEKTKDGEKRVETVVCLGTLTVLELGRLAQENRPSAIFIMKTKSSKEKMERLCHRIGKYTCFTVNFVARGGGLALLWSNDTNIEIINYSNSHIHQEYRVTI